MKYLIIGICGSLLQLASCIKTQIIDKDYITNFIYENTLDIPVKIERHWEVGGPLDKYHTTTIEANEDYIETRYFQGLYEYPIIFECLSARIIFDDAKELWFSYEDRDKPGSILKSDNYGHTQVSDLEDTYTYYITQELYDMATDIDQARE